MATFGAKRSRKMVTIHNLNEMKVAVQDNDSQTNMLVLGLGEAIVTTCGVAKAFLGNLAALDDDGRGRS
jgi:hypothetical protein